MITLYANLLLQTGKLTRSLKTLTVSDSLKTTLTWLINTLSGSDSVGED